MVVGYLIVLPDDGVVVVLGYTEDVALEKARNVISQTLDFLDRPHQSPDEISLRGAKIIPIEKFADHDGTVVCHLAEKDTHG